MGVTQIKHCWQLAPVKAAVPLALNTTSSTSVHVQLYKFSIVYSAFVRPLPPSPLEFMNFDAHVVCMKSGHLVKNCIDNRM